VELVHNFSLIHDDVQDDDRERRHRPTVWAIWGKPQAINAGTAMRIVANSALDRLQANGVPVQKQMWVSRRLDQISLRLIEGQYLDIDFEKRFDIKVEDYMTMVSGKTAALLSGSMEIGAYLGTDNQNKVQGFKEAGYNLGLAFQIRDDILGIWGDEVITGKPAGNDVRRKKKSFPAVYVLENTRGASRRELVNFYRNGSMSEKSVERVLEIFTASGADSKSQEMVNKYCCEAMRAFDSLNLPRQARNDIEELILFLTGRTF
jgi:geranylgeranyl diphosphate synthase type I